MQNKIKRAILSSFHKPETHPTENELFELVKNQVETEYEEFKQTLSDLLDKREVYSVKSSDNKIHLGKQKGPHYHFICNDCGKVRDFMLEEGAYNMLHQYIQKRVHSYGIIDSIQLSVNGKCHECK